MQPTETAWARALYARSVIKQQKYAQIVALLEDPAGLTCLDVGADNGVISVLLRERGGTWHSADLDEASVAAIRALVATNVHQVDGGRTPFADGQFDQVVVIDGLEHLHGDAEFIGELARILARGGLLIVNVPHLAGGTALPWLRNALGQTDARHGHVRPGYTRARLLELLGPRFEVVALRTYSGFLSEAIDAVLNAAVARRPAAAVAQDRGSGPTKGRVMTRGELGGLRGKLVLLSLAYPLLWLLVRLDRSLPLRRRHKLIVKARLRV